MQLALIIYVTAAIEWEPKTHNSEVKQLSRTRNLQKRRCLVDGWSDFWSFNDFQVFCIGRRRTINASRCNSDQNKQVKHAHDQDLVSVKLELQPLLLRHGKALKSGTNMLWEVVVRAPPASRIIIVKSGSQRPILTLHVLNQSASVFLDKFEPGRRHGSQRYDNVDVRLRCHDQQLCSNWDYALAQHGRHNAAWQEVDYCRQQNRNFRSKF